MKFTRADSPRGRVHFVLLVSEEGLGELWPDSLIQNKSGVASQTLNHIHDHSRSMTGKSMEFA